MTLLVHKHLEELFQLLITLARFLLLHHLLSSDGNAITLQKSVISPYIIFENF